MGKKRNPDPKPNSLNGRRVNGSNIKRAEWKERKQTESAERQAYWDSLTNEQKLKDLMGRRGESRKQITRIQDAMDASNNTKKTKKKKKSSKKKES